MDIREKECVEYVLYSMDLPRLRVKSAHKKLIEINTRDIARKEFEKLGEAFPNCQILISPACIECDCCGHLSGDEELLIKIRPPEYKEFNFSEESRKMKPQWKRK